VPVTIIKFSGFSWKDSVIICTGGDKMDQYIGDMGVIFAAILVTLYVLWDRLFPE